MIELVDVNLCIDGKVHFKNDIWDRIISVMNDVNNAASVGEFTGKYDRLALAPYISLITYNNNDVGYIYFVNESRYDYALFVDMVIKKEFRGMGIGTEVLNMINSFYKDKEFLIGEVKPENVSSNIISSKVGILIYRGNNNYYLIQRDRFKEFCIFNKDHLFEKSVDKETVDSRTLVREIYSNI